MVAGQSGRDYGTRARPNGDHLSSVAYTSLTRFRAAARPRAASLSDAFGSVTPPHKFVTVRTGGRAISVEKSRLRKSAPTSVNVTVGRGSRDYLTEREVERLIEAASRTGPGTGMPRPSWLPTATASEPRSWWRCDGTTSTSPLGACMCAGPRAGMPACIRYRPGKVGHCASSCAKPQRRPMSSSRNVVHLFPQPDISAWWPGRAWLRNSAFLSTPTCCGTPAGSSSPTTATTLAPSRPISGTVRSCPRSATRL
jgi:hypothetical protein